MKPTPVKRILIVVAVLLALVFLMSSLAQAQTPVAQPVQVTDQRGVAVRLAQPPQRIVSLMPSLTESVCALGECHRLVGVDRFSNWPEAVKKLPQMGGYIDPNIEAVVALKPDLVLGASSMRATHAVAAAPGARRARLLRGEPRAVRGGHGVLHW